MVGRYIESFDEEPLPVDVAKQAYQRLLNIVDDAEKSIDASASQQLQTLNRVAATELF
jgi:rhamnose utilization protein RhaD (predicted bifunctional aldolase and dehydrogenase)